MNIIILFNMNKFMDKNIPYQTILAPIEKNNIDRILQKGSLQPAGLLLDRDSSGESFSRGNTLGYTLNQKLS
jgi:hypothetical protein